MSMTLFMYYLCDLFYIIIFVSIIINHIVSLKQTHLFIFCASFRICPIACFSISPNNIIKTWIKKMNIFQKAKAQPQGIAWFLLIFFAYFSLVLLVKKEHVIEIKQISRMLSSIPWFIWKRHF